MSDDTLVEQIKKLGEELASVANDKLAREAKIKEVEEVLGNIPIKDWPELAESPSIQRLLTLVPRDDLQPGQVKHRGTLAEVYREWTMQDIMLLVRKGEMKMKHIVPAETLTLIFNGVPLQIIAHEECEIPACFYDIYKEHMFAVKQAGLHERYLMGKGDQPPHPNWITSESALVRAWSLQGEEYGVKGGTLAVGKIDMGEESSGS